jgi:hypothetical protein
VTWIATPSSAPICRHPARISSARAAATWIASPRSSSRSIAIPAAIEGGTPENVPDWKIDEAAWGSPNLGVTTASITSARPP